MRLVAGAARPWPVISGAIVLGALAILVLPIFAGVPAEAVTGAAGLLVLAALTRRFTFQWRSLIGFLILVILFVPIRRYVLPGGLPFQLEPYRLLVALIVAVWLTSLLIDRRVKLRKTGLEAPIALFVGAVGCSIVANEGRISDGKLDPAVFKSLTFLVSFFAVLYVIASVVRRKRDVIFLLKILVGGSAVVAAFAVVESRTGFNVFDHLDRNVPFLRRNYDTALPPRIGRLRAYGPAEHAIALSAALAMMAPLAGYLAYVQRRNRWWVAMGVILLGCLATVSRTGVVMLGVEAFILVVLRPRQMKKLWPALLPLLVAVHIALPGTLGTLKESFFPPGGLKQEQLGFNGTGRLGAERLVPTFKEINAHPIFGIGYGTRIVRSTNANAMILDDQWLVTLLEMGIVGVYALVWLFVRVIRRLMLEARRQEGDEVWLFAALAAALSGFMVSMLTFDALAFTQVSFMFYILVGLSAVVLQLPRDLGRERVAARTPVVSVRPTLGLGLATVGVAALLFDFFQGPSIKFFILILILLVLGAWAIEKEVRRPQPTG
jgi:hypothetical protein